MDAELPGTDGGTTDAATPVEESTSLEEHEAQFSPDAPPRPPEPEAAAPPPAAETTDDRDEHGRFKGRHRAKSQQAGADDVPRIKELTRQLREAERERDALRSAPKLTPPDPVREAPKPAPAPAATTTPAKPTRDQFEDYDLYVEAIADWKADRKWEAHQAAQADAVRQQQAQAETQRIQTSWKAKVDAAIAKYPDFEAVALQAPTQIRPGSLIDAWVLEHKHGADVLYSLQRDPAELARIDSLTAIEQAEALTLLGQRLASPPRTSAASTGSATPPSLKLAPRPPNPVRTGPLKTGDDPPDDEGSLDAHEQYFYKPGRR